MLYPVLYSAFSGLVKKHSRNYCARFSRCRPLDWVLTRGRTTAQCRHYHLFHCPCTICSSLTANLLPGTVAESAAAVCLFPISSPRTLLVCCWIFQRQNGTTFYPLWETCREKCQKNFLYDVLFRCF